jgi:hypothetical protein
MTADQTRTLGFGFHSFLDQAVMFSQFDLNRQIEGKLGD